jgi:hypothetical protein
MNIRPELINHRTVSSTAVANGKAIPTDYPDHQQTDAYSQPGARRNVTNASVPAVTSAWRGTT